MKPKVVVVILNWNKPLDTLECLESFRAVPYEPYEILVVDNHSSDDSVAQIRERFPKATLLQNSENLGYAAGNNVGIAEALKRGADYVFILNNDTVVEASVINELVLGAQEHPRAGLLAPKVLYYDNPDTVNSMGTRMNWFRLRPYLGDCGQKDDGRFEKPVQKDILYGCALFIPRGTVEQIGVLDEKFFIFHEEADWCLRNIKNGRENWVIPSARVRHKASKTMREYSLLTHYYSSRNFLYLVQKNATATCAACALAGLMALSIKHGLWLAAGGQKEKKGRAFFLGIWDYFSGRMGKCTRVFQ